MNTGASSGAGIQLSGIQKMYGEVVAVNNINLDVRAGEFLTLLGPSGCGKTTTLRLIGGFEYPTAGSIMIDGQNVANLPPYKRPVNTVFQQYALFPHMNVARNVGYGLEMAGVGKKERIRRVAEALEMVRLPQVEKRRPSELSGGQQQRIALARALINRPKALLLDEPLGALDLKLRKAMQLELKMLNREVGATFIYVTHDQEEALTMSDRIAVMDSGRILQLGTPEDIYERPMSRFVADFIGQSNHLKGTVLEVVDTSTLVRLESGPIVGAMNGTGSTKGDEVVVSVRPEKLRFAGDSGDSHANRLTGRVMDVIYLGAVRQLVLDIGAGERLIANSEPGNPASVGSEVSISFSSQDATCLEQ